MCIVIIFANIYIYIFFDGHLDIDKIDLVQSHGSDANVIINVVTEVLLLLHSCSLDSSSILSFLCY